MQAQCLTEVSKAAALLQQGGLVAIPTETVYGLAANGLDAIAVARIFEAKKRPFFDPLILHVGSLEQAQGLSSRWPEKAQQLAQAFWPGPLTLVVPKSEHVPDLVSSSLPSVGLRMPKHPLTLSLLQSLEFPLAAPSANPFGYVSPTSAQHVLDQLGNAIEAVLDGGPCEVGIESTIVSLMGDEIHLLRLGKISQEELERVVGPVQRQLSVKGAVQAPGQLEQHYSPFCQLYLLEPGQEAPIWEAESAYVPFSNPTASAWPQDHLLALSQSGDLNEAAAKVFSILRQLDTLGFKKAWIELAPNQGLGLAINDRLRRAAAR
ncbi:MAG: L-threonylcarbamoyladenylate synthase [Bacteroidia bacterium]